MVRHRLLGIVMIVALLGARCGGKTDVPPIEPTTTEPLTLTVWRVFDEPEVFDTIIERYQQLRPNIQVEVVRKDYANYEVAVANAIAAGVGPDLWMIRNDWLAKHATKLQAMPEGLLGTAAGAAKRSEKTNLDVLKEQYPPVVEAEAALDGAVYGVPLAIDTLALYYNKDHFREANLARAPTTWTEVADAVKKLTKFKGDSRDITRAAVAMGTAKTVNRASDLVTLLMLQNHTPMTNMEETSALFNGALTKEGGGLTYPGTTALEFYTGFANPQKEVYTWNNSQENSIDAFAQGKVSMLFSYSYLRPILLQKNPTFNYAVAPMPQIDSTSPPIDYPTYWLEVISRNTKHAAEAWDFMRFLASEGDTLYQQATGKPTAKRLPIIPKASERLLNNDPGSPWNFQTSTAGTWYRGKNPAKVEQIMNEMIENVVTFGQTPQVAIDNAAALTTKSLESQ